MSALLPEQNQENGTYPDFPRLMDGLWNAIWAFIWYAFCDGAGTLMSRLGADVGPNSTVDSSQRRGVFPAWAALQHAEYYLFR